MKELTKLNKSIVKLLDELDVNKDLIDYLNNGQKAKLQYDKSEYKKFKEDWIVNIESFFPSLDHIIRNIKSSLQYEEEILPIERTRRTNPESIRHLLRNTRYIKEVNEQGDVTPEKVLNTLSEIDYGIYENRFIMTLIKRLNDYLVNRLEVIKKNIHGFNETQFKMKNDFNINNTNFNISISLNAKEDFDSSEIDLHNKRLYIRTQDAYKVVSRMYHSDFMRIMSKYKEVKPPILKTQIILKNPDFRNAYMLWLYLDRLHILDYTLESKQLDKDFNKTYVEQLDQVLIMLLNLVIYNSEFKEKALSKTSEKITTPISKDINSYISNLDTKPIEIDLEPQLATQYYLDKAKQILQKQFKSIKETNDKNNQSLKQVLLDQYSIADQIFNYYFEIDQDDDVFDKLITYKDPIRKFNQALEKYHITKTARQVKEKLYLSSIILEDRWIKEATYLQQEALEKLKNSEEKLVDKEIKEINKKINKEISELNKKEINHTKTLLTNQRIRNNKSLKALRDKHNKELRLFKQKQRERLKLERIKALEQKKIRQAKVKERERIKRQKEQQRLREAAKIKREKEIQKLRKEKALIREKNKNKIEEIRKK